MLHSSPGRGAALSGSRHGEASVLSSSSLSAPNNSSSFATSALLREISTLRTRLKELEDDNKSSVAGGSMASPRNSVGGGGTPDGESAVMNALRKELAKVEHEKANLEREFMNQMSSLAGENRALIGDLRDKLARSEALNDELTERLRKRVGLDEDGEHRLLHLERERHAKEMEQLKATLASSDEEIAENRRDMDHLQAQVDDLLSEKEDLERQMGELESLYNEEKENSESLREQLKTATSTTAKLELELQKKDKQIEKHVQEVGDLNDTCIQLQNHKDMLLAEVTDLKLEWNKQGSSKKPPRASPPSIPSLTESESSSTQDDIRMLESRVARFQEKLGERDRTIDNLADSLNEERRASKALKAEIKLLKQQNANLEAAAKDAAPKTPPLSPPTLTRVASHGALDTQPRTPVSGIVASFERRINTSVPTKSPEAKTDASGKAPLVRSLSLDRRTVPASSNSSVATMNTEDDATQLLRMQLEKERSVVTELQSKLSQERLLVRQLRQEMQESKADTDKLDELREQLNEKEQVVLRLANKIKEDSIFILDLEAKLRLEQEVSRKLRADLDESPRKEMKASMGLNQLLKQEQNLVKDLRTELAESAARSEADKATIEELRERLQQEQDAVKGLRAELASALLNGGGDLAAKLNESQREIDRLRSKIQGYEAEKLGFVEKSRKSQSELSKLRMKAHQAHTEKKELQTKVSVTSREMERLRGELSYQLEVGSVTGSVQGSLQDEKKEDYDEDECARLRDQVSDINSELSAAYKEIEKLQAEVDRLKQALEVESTAAEELRRKAADEPLSKHAQKSYDARINQLQVELTRVQVAKAEMEQTFTNRLHDLENELEAMEVEAEQEIENRDAELEELQSKLAQQEALVSRLQVEHTQFCHSMNDVSNSKQGDIDELQAELMSMTSKTSTQARELQSLKIKLEEHETRKQEVVKKYEARIGDLEQEIATLKQGAKNGLDRTEAESIKSENARLREAIREVQMERRSLKDRLDSVMSDKTSSRSAQVLRDRNVALKEEVEKLTKRLKKMEASITRFAI